MEFEWTTFAMLLAGLAISVSVHESAHAWTAWRLGDPTGKVLGRITLNPLAHVDPFGTILLPLVLWLGSNGQFVFGYAKPVPVQPYAFRNPALGSAATAAAGPLSNLLLAVLFTGAVAAISGTGAADTLGYGFLRSMVLLNVGLAVFNLLPVPPLDGGHVLAGFLPRRAGAYEGQAAMIGPIVLVVLMVTGLLDRILMPVVRLVLDALGKTFGVALG